RVITRAQAEKLQAAMAGDGVIVEYGMRYGNPSTQSAIEKLHAQGCDRILLFPLYPQHSATTTATPNDQALRALAQLRAQPAVRTAPGYFCAALHVENSPTPIRDALQALHIERDLAITSYHGVAVEYGEKGGPYYDQRVEPTRLVRE